MSVLKDTGIIVQAGLHNGYHLNTKQVMVLGLAPKIIKTTG